MMGVLSLNTGCERPEGDRLVIATPWNVIERAALEESFAKAHPQAKPIAWVSLLPADNVVKLVPRLGVDLILGIPQTVCDQLADIQALKPVDSLSYRIARRSSLGVSTNSPSLESSSIHSRNLFGKVSIDDPRHDEITMAWAHAKIQANAYGQLVRTAANVARFGRGGESLSEVLRCDISAAITSGIEGPIDDHSSFVKLESVPAWRECVAVVNGSPHAKEASVFLEFLAEQGQADRPTPEKEKRDNLALLRDMLGNCLVDAQDELKDAVIALDRAGHPADLEAYLDDAPPWPPTSITKIRQRDDHEALLETLAHELTDSPESRFRLLESWDHAPKKLDLAQLQMLSTVSNGQLLKEPRFRMWIRAEWTAWARQHYRRIAREAGKVTS
jgi:hypothetical protein